jgi:hypothetical protein
MSRSRFGLLLGLVALVVASGSFAVAMAALDDGKPDAPPSGGTDTGDAPGSDPVVTDTSTTSTTATTLEVVTGDLDTPTWIVVVSSEADEAGATVLAQRVAADGHPAGVLRSNDYPSLNKGFWVAYAGPYPDRSSATAAVSALESAGYGGTYVRCAGTKKDCGTEVDEPDDDGGDDDGD